MIHYLLVQNRQGKTRLSKWYTPHEDEEKRKLSNEVHRLVNGRESKFTNFVEFRNHKIVYRRYAGAAIICSFISYSIVKAVHLFVEILDEYFGNVCELDLVFNFYKVYAILDEVFLAGELMETSKMLVIGRLAQLDSLE